MSFFQVGSCVPVTCPHPSWVFLLSASTRCSTINSIRSPTIQASMFASNATPVGLQACNAANLFQGLPSLDKWVKFILRTVGIYFIHMISTWNSMGWGQGSGCYKRRVEKECKASASAGHGPQTLAAKEWNLLSSCDSAPTFVSQCGQIIVLRMIAEFKTANVLSNTSHQSKATKSSEPQQK